MISYSDSSLEWVDSYEYLGVIVTKSKSFTKYLKLVCQKAGISQTVLDVHTSKHSSVSINHIFELFDMLIKPILTYGCEIWGIGNYTDIELFHLKFIKKTLHVKGSTNRCMLYAETGRFPLSVDINIRIIKYWLKILDSDPNSYMCIVYKEMLNLQNNEWIKHVKQLLRSSGFGYAWESQCVDDTKSFIKLFEQRCKDTEIVIYKILIE